jgi:hypothetical protein
MTLMPSWHPEGYPELPEFIEAQMTADDILRAHAAMLAKGTVCGSCPVAQVMTRTFPDFVWSVGSRDMTVGYPNSAVEGTPGFVMDSRIDLAGAYALDWPTRRFIFLLPCNLGHKSFNPKKAKLPDPILVRAKMFTEAWSRNDWLTDQNWSGDDTAGWFPLTDP